WWSEHCLPRSPAVGRTDSRERDPWRPARPRHPIFSSAWDLPPLGRPGGRHGPMRAKHAANDRLAEAKLEKREGGGKARERTRRPAPSVTPLLRALRLGLTS